MNKRGKLEIIKDILEIIRNNSNSIKPTPLLRKANVSSSRFKGYYTEILKKGFIKEFEKNGEKFVSLQEKGMKFLSRYSAIREFIDEFEL